MRRAKVIVEVEIDILDEAELQRAALANIDATEFAGGDTEKLDERTRVVDDPVAALDWLINPFALTDDLTYVEATEASQVTVELDGTSSRQSFEPDFVALYPVCRCNEESCATCSGFQLTPRTAFVLWSILTVKSDSAFEDINQHGDEPVQMASDWAVFNEYPRITWSQNAVWRRQAARTFDDLAGDLAGGAWPRPTCAGEEMALHHVLNFAEEGEMEGWAAKEEIDALPAYTGDLDWDGCRDTLFQDTDILGLFDPHLDGIEDPDAAENKSIGMGDYHPAAWFETFQNMTPRDGRRPFRR